MIGLKHIGLAALALSLIAPAAQAQQTARRHSSGALLCETDGVVLRREVRGFYTVNFIVTLPGDIATARFARTGLFESFRPKLVLFYAGRLDAEGNADGPIHPFAITGVMGDYSNSLPFPRTDMNLVFDAGSVRSTELTLADFGNNRGVSGSIAETGATYDASDSEMPRDELEGFANAILTNGATMLLFDSGRQVVSVSVPGGSGDLTRRNAVAWANRAFPFLRDGKCPN